MKSEFSRARRHGYPLSCVLMRVDRLPSGMEPGGAEVREVTKRSLGSLVAEKTRDHDQLGVVEDDGYLVVLPHTELANACVVADRIREGFGRLSIQVGEGAVRPTLSLGVAACEDQETLFFDTLLSQAELALEWAMDAGGDRVEVFRRDRYVGIDAGRVPDA